jgi:hypothetical protein
MQMTLPNIDVDSFASYIDDHVSYKGSPASHMDGCRLQRPLRKALNYLHVGNEVKI